MGSYERITLTSSLGVTNNITGTDDVTTQASLPSLKQQLLGYPLGLAVTGLEVCLGALEVIIFWNAPESRACPGKIFGEVDVVLGIDGGC